MAQYVWAAAVVTATATIIILVSWNDRSEGFHGWSLCKAEGDLIGHIDSNEVGKVRLRHWCLAGGHSEEVKRVRGSIDGTPFSAGDSDGLSLDCSPESGQRWGQQGTARPLACVWTPEGLLKHRLQGSSLRDFDLILHEQGPGICISTHFQALLLLRVCEPYLAALV